MLLLPSVNFAQVSYHDHSSLVARLASIARENSKRVSVRSIGKSHGGREIWLTTIGGDGADKRPAVLVVGGIDGSSLVGSELALRFVERIATDRSDSTTTLLNNATYYVIARASPDAGDAYFARPRVARRGNATPYDDDRDGAVDEDGFDDLNGDGLITQMRVRSASGRYIDDPIDARFVREVDATRGERGMYELYSEGRDDDRDGSYNEDPAGGVDITRNFTFNYKNFSAAAGEHAASEIETRAIADFCYDHPNIAVVVSFSPQANLLHPWEARPETGPGKRIIRNVRAGDDELLRRLAKIYSEVTSIKAGAPYVKGEGSFAEWAYFHYGRLSVSTPGWVMTMSKPAAAASDSSNVNRSNGDSATARRDSTLGGDKKADTTRVAIADSIAWLERHGVTPTYVAWTKVNHPDFPGRDVDVGGIAPFATREPPASMLDSLGRTHAEYIRRIAALLPRIEIANLETESLGDGLTRIRATIVNPGYLPTLAAMGETSQVPLDVKAEVTLASGQSIVSGRRVQLLGPIAGNGGSKELSWVIAGRGSVKINVAGPMTGGVERVVALGR
ncbi:MAG: hypothetical protein H7X80_10370 [bacterium]|nr:hypothetical protein [Candidatus Kapabacteria bacterium]